MPHPTPQKKCTPHKVVGSSPRKRSATPPKAKKREVKAALKKPVAKEHVTIVQKPLKPPAAVSPKTKAITKGKKPAAKKPRKGGK